MTEDVAEPLADVAEDVLPLGRLVGVEARPHEPERDGRGDERRRVDEEHGLQVDDCDEHTGQERPGDHRGGVARLKAPVRRHEVVLGDEVGQAANCPESNAIVSVAVANDAA